MRATPRRRGISLIPSGHHRLDGQRDPWITTDVGDPLIGRQFADHYLIALHVDPATLTVTNSEGTSVTQTFTGQTVSNNGGPSATVTHSVIVPIGGYDLAGSDGGVFVFPTGQSAGFFGSLPGLGVKVNDVVGIVPTNNFTGYNLVGSDGGVFVFGNAPFLGSLPGIGVHVSNITGIAATPSGQGYYVVGADGRFTPSGTPPRTARCRDWGFT